MPMRDNTGSQLQNKPVKLAPLLLGQTQNKEDGLAVQMTRM